MLQAPLLSRIAVQPTALRWAIAIASAVSSALAIAAFVANRPLAFLGVFCADILIAALATVANEPTLEAHCSDEAPHPSPEELAIYTCLHCGVLALLMLMFPGGPVGAGLLAVHQALLWINARSLPAA